MPCQPCKPVLRDTTLFTGGYENFSKRAWRRFLTHLLPSASADPFRSASHREKRQAPSKTNDHPGFGLSLGVFKLIQVFLSDTCSFGKLVLRYLERLPDIDKCRSEQTLFYISHFFTGKTSSTVVLHLVFIKQVLDFDIQYLSQGIKCG